MPSLNIILTGCNETKFQHFAKAHALGEEIQAKQRDDRLVCTLPVERMEDFYSVLKEEALHGWQNPKDENVLEFDSAYFPQNATSFQPMRQLRGKLAARLAVQMEELPPAHAVPLTVFGAEDDD